MERVSSLASSAAPTSSPVPTHSASSSNTSGSSPPPRFWAVRLRQREKARSRVIFARNSRSTAGFLGGMDCQTFRYVSFRASSASSRLGRMALAREKQ